MWCVNFLVLPPSSPMVISYRNVKQEISLVYYMALPKGGSVYLLHLEDTVKMSESEIASFWGLVG